MRDAANILDQPTYSAAVAGRLVGMRPERVRRWLSGYEYRVAVPGTALREKRRQKPVVARGGAADSRYASFLDLIDLLFVKKFLDQGLSLQRLRRALKEAEEFVGGHHFAQREFWTDGTNIFLKVEGHADALMHLLANGQWAIAQVIQETALQIDFDRETGFAERWFPLPGDRSVVVDPRVAFGAPSVAGVGVTTANVYDMYLAEGEREAPVSAWMDLPLSAVSAAVRFETTLKAA